MKENSLFDNVWTVPNLLTFSRILLVPVFAVLFYRDMMIPAVAVLFASGLTDFFDGKIARRFNQVSSLGKVLDPIADKLTQITIAVLLFFEFRVAESHSLRAFAWVFLIYLAKEGLMLVGGAVMLSKGMRPGAAEIFGKIATFVFYAVMLLIICFGPEVGAFIGANGLRALPESLTMALVVISALLTVGALFGYAPAILAQFRENREKKNAELK